MNYSEEKIRSYVEKCFKDAFAAEERQYNHKQWNFDYIIIKNDDGNYQLFPINFWCKFERVISKVRYRLNKNLYKNFGILYGGNAEFNLEFYEKPNTIDVTRSIALLKTDNGKKKKLICVSLLTYDTLDNLPNGVVIPNGIYEKLVLTYHNINAETYRKYLEEDERKSLGISFSITKSGWEAYNHLWEQAFCKPIKKYDIICSYGVKLVEI